MDKVRIGIIGMGQRACFHGGALCSGAAKERTLMAAVCDNRPERLEYGHANYQEVFGGEVEGYLDYREMFEKANLDGVYIASPTDLHGEMTIAALEAGIHVLCEKPMELTLAKCDEMAAAARKSGKILAMGMQMAYRHRYHKVREIIQSGAIGKVAQVWVMEYRDTYREMKDWVWDPKRSGGAIFEKNCHHTDLMNFWLDDEPTTVYASGNIMKHKTPYGYESQIVDNAFVVNDFKGGARGMINICFLKCEGQHEREFGIHGTEGKIFFSWNDGEIIHVDYNTGHKEHHDMRQNQWFLGGLEADFVDCILTGREPLVGVERGKQSLLVPMAAEQSIVEQRIVHVDELR